MQKAPFVSLLLLASLASVTAADAAESDCHALTADSERLACYDRVTGFDGSLSAAPDPQSEPVAWSVDTEVSPMTDQKNVFISVSANETLRCGYQPIRPTLYLRCMDNTTAALLVTGCFMADIEGYGEIRYRIDDRAAKTRNFEERTDNMALGLWTYGSSVPFIRELFEASRLVMEFTPYNEIPLTATFDIRGTEDAIAPLRKECGW